MTGLKFLIAICICLSPIKAFAQHKPDSLEKRINQTTDLEEKLNLYYALIDYYIAFEGNAKMGRGICIDDIVVSVNVGTEKISRSDIGYAIHECT